MFDCVRLSLEKHFTITLRPHDQQMLANKTSVDQHLLVVCQRLKGKLLVVKLVVKFTRTFKACPRNSVNACLYILCDKPVSTNLACNVYIFGL